ncbi:VP1 major capsid protein [Bat polyomavirus 6d]|uniref:VP1 major capsid protein n=1 Tax=Bat polyomavirus 6d TaxID=1623686 RepID=UPI0005D8E38C|nr:VP1 major capsid protein [Bat polyomavirus 6d]BAQ55555.1 VP1 major capsid protein [Bat polyomavirus 6d]BAQ55559.1 VP1 major capsid protein [Bat polyomavirus 6d]
MAPKRKSVPRKGPAEVPRLIISGGIEVLSVKTGPDSITEIEAFLNPRMGEPADSDFYGYSENITVATDFGSDMPGEKEIPCYSMAQIKLPILNEDMTCSEILMWEAVSVKTEVVGVTSLVNVHSAMLRAYPNDGPEGAGTPIGGLSLHFFAVGGEPLDLQYCTTNYRTDYKKENKTNKPLQVIQNPGKAAQVLDPKLKGILNLDDAYPIETWVADPAKNENTRYFGSFTGGLSTPPVLQFTNTTTTILLNENGVGPLCKSDTLFLSAADITGFFTQNNHKMKYRGLGRYFNVTLRKRLVKNPYPVSLLLSTLFNRMGPQVHGQTMQGEDAQVEEVRVFDGVEKLPGDPDMIRYRDQLGNEITRIPMN